MVLTDSLPKRISWCEECLKSFASMALNVMKMTSNHVEVKACGGSLILGQFIPLFAKHADSILIV